jgi:hypothetical protein
MSEILDAVRALLRPPGPALLACLVLALGTGATTAIFSAINGVLLRPMPFVDSYRLVQFEPMGVLDSVSESCVARHEGGSAVGLTVRMTHPAIAESR